MHPRLVWQWVKEVSGMSNKQDLGTPAQQQAQLLTHRLMHEYGMRNGNLCYRLVYEAIQEAEVRAAGVGAPAPLRYDYGYAGGREGMHQRADGAYAKWSDVQHVFGVGVGDSETVCTTSAPAPTDEMIPPKPTEGSKQ